MQDIEKRNNLSKDGFRQLWVPAKYAIDKEYYSVLNELLRMDQVRVTIPTKGMPIPGLPSSVAEETLRNFISGLPNTLDSFLQIDQNALMLELERVNSPLCRQIVTNLRKMDQKLLPLAIQNQEYLLFQANQTLVNSDNMEAWMDWLIMISGFNAIGFKTLIVWNDRRSNANTRAKSQ
ncbi:MAG: hypothetical protein IPK04_15510 [Bdellovibrionales bacterium]|nr:hypothetical protein [Bdellovibrionales bacterium]